MGQSVTIKGKRMKRTMVASLVAITVIHAIVSMWFLLLSFAISMKQFDTGNEMRLGGNVVEVVSAILLFPIFAPLSLFGAKWNLGIVGYIPLLINSFIWAVGMLYVYRLIKRMRGKRSER